MGKNNSSTLSPKTGTSAGKIPPLRKAPLKRRPRRRIKKDILEKVINVTDWCQMTVDERQKEGLGCRIVVCPASNPNTFYSRSLFACAPLSASVVSPCPAKSSTKKFERSHYPSDEAWNNVLNTVPLEKNSEYVLGPYTYKTDEEGRVCYVEGQLDLTDDPESYRNAYQQSSSVEKKGGTKRADGLYKNADDGGHIIGAQFKGPGQQINYFPQHMVPNEFGQWSLLESSWAKELKAGNQVDVQIHLIYPPSGGMRPEALEVVSKVTSSSAPAKIDHYIIENPRPVTKHM